MLEPKWLSLFETIARTPLDLFFQQPTDDCPPISSITIDGKNDEIRVVLIDWYPSRYDLDSLARVICYGVPRTRATYGQSFCPENGNNQYMVTKLRLSEALKGAHRR